MQSTACNASQYANKIKRPLENKNIFGFEHRNKSRKENPQKLTQLSSRFKFTTNFDRCAMLIVSNCLANNFDP